jgi:nitrate/nitrite transporter NarK
MGVATPAILMVPLGLFLKSMTGEFGWTRTEFSGMIAAASVFYALVMPFGGYLVDRFGARSIIAIGTALGCCSYAALSLAHSYGELIAIMIAAVTLGNLASYPAFMGLARRWFDKRLGVAFAITSTGQAVGVAVFSYVITRTIALHGWRAAFLTVGIAALVIGLANLVFFVRDNEGPVPAAERRHDIDGIDNTSVSLKEALRTRDFWLYSGSFLLVIFAVVGCNVHLPALLSDRGASPTRIASVVALGSAGSLFGRLFTGMLLDRFSVRIVAGIFYLAQVIGLLLLLGDLQWALPASVLLGAVQGAEIDVLGYVVARRFGRLAYSRIYGACFAVSLVGAIVGPVAMATIFDRTGSYDLGLMLFPLCPVLAFGLLCAARLSPRTSEPRGVLANL